EGRPEKAELEAEDGPGHRADRERDRRDLRPALGELQRNRVVLAQPAVIGDQHQRRERHAEAGENDVEAEGERHLAARREQLRGGGEGEQMERQRNSSSRSGTIIRAAASIRARCEKAWGKLPRWRPVSVSNSSA